MSSASGHYPRLLVGLMELFLHSSLPLQGQLGFYWDVIRDLRSDSTSVFGLSFWPSSREGILHHKVVKDVLNLLAFFAEFHNLAYKTLAVYKCALRLPLFGLGLNLDGEEFCKLGLVGTRLFHFFSFWTPCWVILGETRLLMIVMIIISGRSLFDLVRFFWVGIMKLLEQRRGLSFLFLLNKIRVILL